MLKIATIVLSFAFTSLVSSDEPFCDPNGSVSNNENSRMVNIEMPRYRKLRLTFFQTSYSTTPLRFPQLRHDFDAPRMSTLTEMSLSFVESTSQFRSFHTLSQIRIDNLDTKISKRIFPKTDELLAISGNKCSTTKLSDRLEDNIQMLAFRLDDVSKMKYHGKSRMKFWPRDLHIWSRCLRVTGETVVNTTYYLEIVDDVPRPVRSVVMFESSRTLTFDVTEYTNYVAQKEATFAIPKHIVCKRSRPVLDAASLGDHFYYEEEMIQPFTKSIAYNKIWHYSDLHLRRVDFTQNNTRFSQIIDYKEDIEYLLNRKSGSCERRKMGFTSKKRNVQDEEMTKDGLFTVVNSLQVIARTNNAFYYQGEPSWQNTTTTATSPSTVIPVMLIVLIGKTETRYIYSKFTRNTRDFSAFDTTPCFHDGRVISLTLTIPGIIDVGLVMVHYPIAIAPGPDVTKLVKQLRDQTRNKLKEVTRVDVHRIQNIRVWQDHVTFYVGVSILDTDAYILRFVPVVRPNIPGPVTLTLHGVPNIETCAARCARHQNMFCMTITFCSKERLCYLSKSRPVISALSGSRRGLAATGASVGGMGKGSTDTNCKHLLRKYLPFKNPPLLDEVYSRLRTAVRGGRVKFRVASPSGSNKAFNTLSVSQIRMEYGLLELEKMPSVPGLLSYRVELHVPHDMPRWVTKHVYYSNEHQILRVHSRYRSFMSKKERLQTVITNFQSGERYKIYDKTGDCEVTTAQVITLYDHPLYFFNDAYRYKAIGQTTVRGIICTIFKSTVPEIVFNKPVTIHYLVAAPKKDFKIDIFDVETNVDESRLSISACFHRNSKIRFVMTFPVRDNFKLENERYLIRALHDYLTRNLSLPTLAVADDVIKTDSRNLYYSITLLDKQGSGRNKLYNVYTRLVNNVYLGYVTLKIQYTIGQGPVRQRVLTTYSKAISIAEVDDLRKPTNIKSALRMRRFFKAIPHHSETSTAGWVGQTAIDGCASHCVEITSIDCHSFMYCFDHHYCTIFDERRPTKRQYGSDCRFYVRNFLDDYNLLGGTQRALDGGTVGVRTTDLCAKSCTKNSKDCKGFTYCRDTRTCVLSRTHELPVTTSGNSAWCLSYSRNYLSDFVKFPSRLLRKGASSVLQGLSPSQCARKCALTATRGCVEFDFCKTTQDTECYLYAHEAPFTYTAVKSRTCDRYVAHVAAGKTAATTTTTTTTTPATTKTTTNITTTNATIAATTTLSQILTNTPLKLTFESEKSSFSTGEVAGLAVGTFFIGVLLIFIVFLLIRCICPKRVQ